MKTDNEKNALTAELEKRESKGDYYKVEVGFGIALLLLGGITFYTYTNQFEQRLLIFWGGVGVILIGGAAGCIHYARDLNICL